MTYIKKKELIKNFIDENKQEEALAVLKEIEKEYPFDLDVLKLKGLFYSSLGDYKKAIYWFQKCRNICTINVDVNIFLMNIYISLNLKDLIIDYFSDIIFLNYFGDKYVEIFNTIFNNIVNKNANDHEFLSLLNNKIERENGDYRYFPLNCKGKSSLGEKVGNLFIANFANTDFMFEPEEKNVQKCSLELVKILHKDTNIIKLENFILPIASKIQNNKIAINDMGTENKFNLMHKNRFYYFNLKRLDDISFDENIVFGEPIVLEKKEGCKDLVLNLFIDGLSQKIIDDYGLENLMPHTAEFFKDGVIFENCYSSGEWTYVSLASFFTGQYTANHNLFNPIINAKLRKDTKILTEYMEDKGYFNAKIDADWRTTPQIGYNRGMDRILYTTLSDKMFARGIPANLMEHIEAFKDKNLFIHTCIPDLHDISDGYNLNISVETTNDLKDKALNVNFKVPKTSVQDTFDESKIRAYLKVMKYIDMHLKSIYTYIEDTFNMDNVTVCLISDHGQGYIVPENDQFLSDGRQKVPLMIKTKEVKNIKTDEFVQGLDLMAILDKILGLNVKLKKIDSKLPKCFGGCGRDYTYSESIYPSQTYKAFINIEDLEFFFETKENVQETGRVMMEEYSCFLRDKKTKDKVSNQIILEKCKKIVFDHMKYNRIYV